VCSWLRIFSLLAGGVYFWGRLSLVVPPWRDCDTFLMADEPGNAQAIDQFPRPFLTAIRYQNLYNSRSRRTPKVPPPGYAEKINKPLTHPLRNGMAALRYVLKEGRVTKRPRQISIESVWRARLPSFQRKRRSKFFGWCSRAFWHEEGRMALMKFLQRRISSGLVLHNLPDCDRRWGCPRVWITNWLDYSYRRGLISR